MHFIVLITGCVDQWVGLKVSGIRVQSVTLGAVIDPFAVDIVCITVVVWLEADGRCEEITPSFAHAARLHAIEAARIGRASAETVGN